jgi:hypothetical protein
MPATITAKSELIQTRDAIVKLRPIQPGIFRKTNPKETLLIIEGETATTKQSTDPDIKFIGTKHTMSCIFVHITNGEEHFSAHINGRRGLDFGKALAVFDNKKNLTVTLVGGNSKSLQESNKNLEFIISGLINAAKSHKTTFTITAQKVLQHNDFTDEDLDVCIYNKIFEKADILHRYLYGKPLDTDLLDVSLPDFEKKSTFSKENETFSALLWAASAVMGNQMLPALLQALPQLNKQKKFITLLKEQFGDAGKKFYATVLKHHKLLPNASQTSFAINIANGEVFPIPQDTFVPHEFYNPSSEFFKLEQPL